MKPNEKRNGDLAPSLFAQSASLQSPSLTTPSFTLAAPAPVVFPTSGRRPAPSRSCSFNPFGFLLLDGAFATFDCMLLGSSSYLGGETNFAEQVIAMAEIEDWETFLGGTSDSEVSAPDSNDEEEHCYASGDLPKLQSRKQMSTARWKEEWGVAEIVAPKGKWTTTGLVRNGKIYCTIEETLYLSEVGALHLLDNGDGLLTLEDLYKKVSEGKGGCCWESFEVYRHMKKYGYVVQRHGVPWSIKNVKSKSTSVEDTSEINVNIKKGDKDENFIFELFDSMQINEARPVFDVYPPNSKFKKSTPGNPTCVLCLTSVHPPSKPEIEELERRCNGTPLKFCHVDHGRVSFISFDRVELPVLP